MMIYSNQRTMTQFTHFNQHGDAHMVDVSAKNLTHRIAKARGFIEMNASTLSMIASGNHKKGDVLSVARIAGIMACKRTADLIPLCHQVTLTHMEINFAFDFSLNRIHCEASASTVHVTGIEIEALLAVQIALLTIYDMCKSVDRFMNIGGICLMEKSGGKSGNWTNPSNEDWPSLE